MTLLQMFRGMVFGAIVLAPVAVMAQPPGPPDDDDAPPPRRRGGARGGENGDGPPGGFGPPPFIAALDADRDGEISAAELSNAAKALKKLDHNGDGVLDRSELEPRVGGPEGFGDEGPGGPPPGGPGAGRRAMGRPRGGPDGTGGGGFGGPGGAGRPPGGGRGGPQIGRVLPPFARDELSLTAQQEKQIAELETMVKGKLESILTSSQLKTLRSSMLHGPGGPGGPGRGPGGGGFGGPPGGGPDDDEPPVRPGRP
jgi:hypothetical protein